MGANEKLFTRFIPRESLGEAASWEFQSLAGAGTEPRGMERLLSERERRAYDRGHAEGMAAGAREVMAQRAQHGREVAQALAELRGRFSELEAGGAEQILDLSLAIARAVLCREVEVPRTALLPALREAVALVIDQQAHPRVHLNPHDLALIKDDLDHDGLLAGCRFIADHSVGRGGCTVQTAQGEVDARLESRWRRVVEALGLPEAAAVPPGVPAAPLAEHPTISGSKP